MGKPSRIAAFLAATLAFTSGAQALTKVHRDGRYLYNEDGSRFYIKGVAYQPQGEVTATDDNPFLEPSSFIDPLADGAGCQRDAPFLQQLGVNVVRVYSVDSTLNHDACMSALSGVGIYTMIDLSLPLNGSIDRSAPSWSTSLLDLYLNTINVFSKYDNVLGYNVGNEVVTSANGTATAAFIKAAARDVKAYLNSKSLTSLVGYAAIDADTTWLVPFADYLSCDASGKNDGATSIDIFGLNNYEWCGDAQPSVYNSKNTAFQDYNVAAYFSEYGCIFQPPRLWTEVAALFSSPMTDIWSGGIAFSYFPAQSAQGQFGMVTISGNTVTTSDDYDRLKAQYSQVSAPNSPTATGSTTFPTCPAEDGTNQLASTNLPPTPNQKTCDCVVSALACRFDPKTTNTSVIIGTLIDEGCNLLGQQGGSCDSISSDGAAGKYGAVSFCDPSTKLSYVMDQFYELTNRNAQSCDFGGNATVVSGAPASAASVSAAVSSCLSGAIATFVPSAPSTTASSGNNAQNTASGTSGSNNNNGAVAFGSQQAWMGAVVATAFSVVGAAFVFA